MILIVKSNEDLMKVLQSVFYMTKGSKNSKVCFWSKSKKVPWKIEKFDNLKKKLTSMAFLMKLALFCLRGHKPKVKADSVENKLKWF